MLVLIHSRCFCLINLLDNCKISHTFFYICRLVYPPIEDAVNVCINILIILCLQKKFIVFTDVKWMPTPISFRSLPTKHGLFLKTLSIPVTTRGCTSPVTQNSADLPTTRGSACKHATRNFILYEARPFSVNE